MLSACFCGFLSPFAHLFLFFLLLVLLFLLLILLFLLFLLLLYVLVFVLLLCALVLVLLLCFPVFLLLLCLLSFLGLWGSGRGRVVDSEGVGVGGELPEDVVWELEGAGEGLGVGRV